MFEKIVLADGILGPIADKVYRAEPTQLGGLDAWMGTLAFAARYFLTLTAIQYARSAARWR